MDQDPRRQSLWRRIRRLTEPETAGETAALMGAAFTPGLGTSLDAVDLAAGIQDRDPVRAGIGLAALALPFVGASHLKAAKRGITSLMGREAPNAVRAAGRSGGSAASMPGEAIADMLEARRGPLALPASPKFDVLHGSKHDFAPEPGHPLGRLRTDFMGEGEGHQAFGWGIYTAENPGVAQRYRDLAPQPELVYKDLKFGEMPDGSFWKMDVGLGPDELPRHMASDIKGILRSGLSPDETRKGITTYLDGALNNEIMALRGMSRAVEASQKKLDDLVARGAKNPNNPEHSDYWDTFHRLNNEKRLVERHEAGIEKISHWAEQDPSGFTVAERPGGIYNVEVNEDPRAFLDLDTPLNEQPEHIRNLFPGGIRQLYDDDLANKIRHALPGTEAEVIEHARHLAAQNEAARLRSILTNRLGIASLLPGNAYPGRRVGSASVMRGIGSLTREAESPAEIAQELRRHGVPGIRFFDGFSRNKGSGTRNYVLFDTDNTRIVGKGKRNGGLIE